MKKAKACILSAVNQKTEKLVLIGGMPRSGTTLLTHLISEEFGIPFSPETHFFTAAYGPNGELATERLPAEVMMDQRVAAAYENIKHKSRSVSTFRKLLADILGASAVYGEKTPAHLTAFESILEEDKATVCIVIVRDFYAIIRSLRNVPWNSGHFVSNLKRCARYWRITHALQRRFPNRLFIVHYNDICTNKKSVINALSYLIPKGSGGGGGGFFNPSIEWWKINASDEPKKRDFEVHWRGAHEQFFAMFVYSVCALIWPLRFEK